MDTREKEWSVIYWLDMAQDGGYRRALVNREMNIAVP
jgi:hypothetical protein